MPNATPNAMPKVSFRSLLGLALLVLAVSGASQWMAGRQSRVEGEQLAVLARVGDIQMLSSDTCGVCVAARAWFTQHGVAFSECSIERDAACRARYDAMRAPGTPVIVVRGQPQLGFSPARLQRALATPRV